MDTVNHDGILLGLILSRKQEVNWLFSPDKKRWGVKKQQQQQLTGQEKIYSPPPPA